MVPLALFKMLQILIKYIYIIKYTFTITFVKNCNILNILNKRNDSKGYGCFIFVTKMLQNQFVTKMCYKITNKLY